MSKPNCYECAHRRSIPGNEHSRCAHPATGKQHPMMELLAILGPARGMAIPPAAASADLGVTGHPAGIRGGWFAWPFNYDPTWLLTCNGFESRASSDRPPSEPANP